jgi:hypothetical protein
MSNITNIHTWLVNVNLWDNLIFQIKEIRVSEGVIFYSEKDTESFGTSERFEPGITLFKVFRKYGRK